MFTSVKGFWCEEGDERGGKGVENAGRGRTGSEEGGGGWKAAEGDGFSLHIIPAEAGIHRMRAGRPRSQECHPRAHTDFIPAQAGIHGDDDARAPHVLRHPRESGDPGERNGDKGSFVTSGPPGGGPSVSLPPRKVMPAPVGAECKRLFVSRLVRRRPGAGCCGGPKKERFCGGSRKGQACGGDGLGCG